MKTMPYNLSIPTTSSILTSLSQSKALTSMHDKNSVALTTGKIVNTSYDNSTLYFKDMRLTERAEGLQSVLDGLSNIVSTLDTAGKSIDAITDLLSQAKAAANSALDGQAYLSVLTGKNFTTRDEENLSDLPNVKAGDEILLRTGDADKMESDILMNKDMTLADLDIVKGEKFKIKVGENDWVTLKVIDEDMKISDFFGQISEQYQIENFSYEIKDQKLTLSTTDRSAIMLDGDLAEVFGFDLSETHKITIEDGWTVHDLAQAFSKIDGISATVNSEGYFQVSSIYGDNLSIADLTGKTAAAFGVDGWEDGGTNTTKTYADQYNEILKQINNIVADSSFNGLNLLEGDSIRAVFDEKASSFRTVNGVKMDAGSLGLEAAVNNWENEEDIQAAFDAIESAFIQAQRAADKFERASYMVQSRETFLEAMSNTSLSGAEKLTGADLNAVSAELLAIETQKQLVNQVISITLEADSSVLSLF